MKVAVSIPDPVFEAAEQLAQSRNVPRSQLIAEALREYLACHSEEAITSRLNAFFADQNTQVDDGLSDAQLASVDDEAW